MQNDINVDQKERHTIPRHQIQQVASKAHHVAFFFSVKFIKYVISMMLCDCMYPFQVICTLCGTEQEVIVVIDLLSLINFLICFLHFP